MNQHNEDEIKEQLNLFTDYINKIISDENPKKEKLSVRNSYPRNRYNYDDNIKKYLTDTEIMKIQENELFPILKHYNVFCNACRIRQRVSVLQLKKVNPYSFLNVDGACSCASTFVAKRLRFTCLHCDNFFEIATSFDCDDAKIVKIETIL